MSIAIAASKAGKSGEMPEAERPVSELYRLAAKEWVEKEKAASLLEESKTSVLSQKMLALGEMPVSRAEMHVKASPDWHDYIRSMVEARAEANLAKVKMKWTELLFAEWQSADANARRERQMGRQAP